MTDEVRVTWAGVFLTLGGTMAVGFVARWLVWKDDGGYGSHPQVLWTMGFLAVGLLLVAVQLYVPVLRHQNEAAKAERARREADEGYWEGE